ncbi:MAG: MMPL family transporter [Treponemataceae bacterium]|nr:MMPL family transporter [Treponemataceae bacterium]
MKLAKSFFKHPWIIITLCVVLTGFLGYFIKDLQIDNSIRQFLPQKDASYTRLTETENQFGSMIVIGVSLEDTDGDILTPENLAVVRAISDRCLQFAQVDGVDSLTHIDYVCNADGSISATQLIPEDFTGSAEDITQLKGRLTEWSEMYNRVIINDDNSATQMQITIASHDAEEGAEGAKKMTDAERQQKVLEDIRQVVIEETAGHPNLVFKIFGDPVVAESARSFMLSDLLRLIPLVVLVVLLSLYFSFKSLEGTLLPLITVCISTVWTMGLMAMTGVTFTLVSSVIPVSLIAVGSAYGIHVLTHYAVALNAIEGPITEETHREAVFAGLEEVKKAVILAGITTIVGFISLVSSPIDPLHSFAIFTAIGVGISLLLAVTFIPAVLLCKNVEKLNAQRSRKSVLSEKLSEKLKHQLRRRHGLTNKEASGNTMFNIYRFFCGTTPRLVLFIIVIIGVSIMGLSRLNIDTALVNYFPKDSDLRQDIDYVDRQFAGTNSVYFTITGENPGDMKNPEILKAVDDMQAYLADRHEGIGKIVSFTTFVKRINQVWFAPVLADTDFGYDDDFSFGFDDDFGFGDDDFGFDDFGFGFEDDSAAADDYVDPNVAYVAKLKEITTVQDVLNMLSDAYVKAGGQNATVSGMIDVIEREYNYNGKAYYEIPYDPAKYPVVTREELEGVVDGYLTLLSGSLERFLDDEMNPMVMRVTCQLRNHSTQETGDIIADAKAFAAQHFPAGYTIEATGAGEMEYTMTNMIVSSQISSLLISLVSVFIIITLSFGSGWAGLLGAVPLALAIILNYMVMGFTGINLDLVTSIIASVAVGVGIDYTIHFLTTYREERTKTDDLEEVTKQTFIKSGHGIVTNALAVGFGFLVLCFSKFVVLRYIGILVAIVMFTSSFLAMTVIPGCLNEFNPKFIRPKSEK